MKGRVQIDRLAVRNYRSIQQCDVELAPLTFFIGANASGKTSFVDAILFVASAVEHSLEKASLDRGGIRSILHHPVKLPADSYFRFYFSSSVGYKGEFYLELKILEGPLVVIAREECRISDPDGQGHHYVVEAGSVRGSAVVFPAVSKDRIYLSNASGLPEFRDVFEFLIGTALTEPVPTSVHRLGQGINWTLRRLDPGHEQTDLAGAFGKLRKTQPARLEIIEQYLRAIAPPFDRIDLEESNGTLWVQFIEKNASGLSVPFYLSQASSGLVNSAEMLLELFKLPDSGKPASCVIIEEPEAFLHPAAVQVLRDAFLEASKTRQLLVTTHSPDLLDDRDIPPEYIRLVQRDVAGTHISRLDRGTESILRDQLYTAGQLLRQGGLILQS